MKRSVPLALALLGASLAAAQRIDVNASYDDGSSYAWNGGSATGTTYHTEMELSQGGINFQTATADANYRTVKLVSQVTNSGLARASATISDTFRFTAPGQLGQWGVAYAWVRAHADTTVSPVDANPYDYESSHGQSMAYLGLSVGANSFTWRQEQSAFEYWSEGDSAPHGETDNETRLEMFNRLPNGKTNVWKPTAYGDQFYLPFYFKFGETLDVSVRTWARANVYGGGRSLADFGNTYQWQGIDKVCAVGMDGTETSLTGWSMVSKSGTDYAAPVPEPASMLALGAGALALLRRKARAA